MEILPPGSIDTGRRGTGIDLFAGISGWDLAAQRLGWQMDGVENWADARATRDAAGLKTIHDDVTTFEGEPGSHDLLLGAPPCQTFSVSGKQAGMGVLDVIIRGCHSYVYPHLYGKPLTADELAFATGDERTGLVLEPLRLALRIRPKFIALEQVKQVLPVWEQYAWVLRANGYSVDYGILDAVRFGVPQTRERAILVARNDGKPASLPSPTRVAFDPKTDPVQQLAGCTAERGNGPWVSMARALGLDYDTWVGFPRKADGREEVTLLGRQYRKRDLRSARQPAFTLTEKARSWSIWPEGKGIPRPLTIDDALMLQSFPEGYPVQGSRTSQFLQVANAIPPLMAEAILKQFNQ